MRAARYMLFMMAATLLLSGMMMAAQSNNIVLTLAVPEWMNDVFDEELFDAFEAENPGVVVHVKASGDEAFFGGAAYSPEEFFENSQAFASSADVLPVSSWNLTVEATRAGHFLDLAPLVSGDPTLNESDFFPAIWESVQWDNGIWMLPVSADIELLIYDQTAFDEAGLAYPDPSWTLDDLANAARTLTERNAEGEVTLPGMTLFNPAALFASLLGHGFHDSSVIPNTPQLATPELEELLTQWMELEEEGITGMGFEGDWEAVPIKIEGAWRLWQPAFDMDGEENPDDPVWAGSLLPGGRAGLTIQGFAVSAGTAYREQAYALAKFLTSNPEVVNRFFGSTPARQSMVGIETEDTAFFPDIPADVQALIDEAVANAIPISELRFAEYVNVALNKMRDEENPLDAATALQEAENEALDNLAAAEEHRNTTTVFVATPVPTPVLAAGETALDFAFTSMISPMPHREELEALIDEFVTSDPQVGQIVLETGFQQDYSEAFDCYYLPYNAVPGADLTTLLNLDPFMSADPAFDPNDFVGNSLSQVQRDNLTWAYPLVIQPAVLWYHSEKFAESGAIEPDGGWTIDEFNDAIEMLHVDPDDPAPFQPQSFGSTDLLLLIAAYGGVPLDYRTIPPTINYTDPASVDAIRQVLDLAKAGYIEYRELANFSGGSGSFAEAAILTDSLNAMNWRLQNMTNLEITASSDYVDPYRLTTYPVGSQYTPVSYDIGAAYISANAENPEACYRWITALAQHPEIFSAMPARRSLLDAANVTLSQGQDLVDFYRQIDELMQQPNAMIFPSQFSGGDNTPNAFIVQFWLNRAFDRYVLEDADLEAELAEAESNALAYLECAANIPPFDPAQYETQAQQVEYFRQFGDCATAIDPSLEPLFSFGEEE